MINLDNKLSDKPELLTLFLHRLHVVYRLTQVPYPQ